MPSNAPDLNFGPSERFLPGNKLAEGDVIKMNILDFEKEEVDTDYGSKFQFYLNVLSSSTDVVSLGKYTWRTRARAPRKVHAYWVKQKTDVSEFSHWVWRLKVVEYGYSLKTLNSGSVQSDDTTKHGTPAPGHGIAGDGEV
jgi:hypothetical protein